MKAFSINIFKLASITAIILATNTAIFSQTYEIDNVNGLTTNTCSGTFYDAGGSGAQYGNNENYTTTFCSGTGQCIDLNFTAFRTDGAADVLTVYDGPSTASPVIGTYSGNLGGFGNITSSGTCLTFRFVSDGSGTRLGWSATITCITKECPSSTSITPVGTQTICQNNAAPALSATVPVTGTCGTPTIQYQWYSNTIGGNTIASSAAISGATTSTYTPPTVTLGTTYYFCVGYAANNGCAQTATTQSQASNAVQVTIVAPPTASAAGVDQSICIGSTATLAANTPAIGTGTWTVTSGPSTSSSQFSSTSVSNAVFTPAGGVGTYVLRWTVSNAPCTASTDDVTITVTCGGGCPACPTDYLHPTSGIANENVGSCLVSDCGPFNYYDNGGPSGNYATGTSVGGFYRVFCPNTAGNCMQVTFNAFNTEASIDYLTIGNGPTQNSTLFTTPPANGLGRISGTPAVPFSYTSSHSSGCLTFRFRTDGSVVSSGWAAVLSCVPCAGGPSGTDNNDCINATGVCSNSSISSNSTGPGISAEGCTGVVCPAGGENHTNWYKIKAASTGPLEILVTPTTATDDYDVAIFGPNVTCGALGSPIRCTDSGGTGNTGAVGTPGDNSEDVTGDKFINRLNVIAGEEYYIMIDEWTPTGAGYTLSFPVIAGGASLDCTVLPVELSMFEATYNTEEKGADLHWRTESERNNDYFTIEKSTNGIDYSQLAIVDGAGTTNLSTDYYAYDPAIESGVTYYRLKQTDIDGKFKYSEIRTINVLSEDNDKLTLFPNPTSNKTELVFNCYHNETALITVCDSKGFVLFTKEYSGKKGSNNTSIDLSDYTSGIYIINLTTSTKVYSSKLIKE
jgi:Secretion system C-terminal sorting domain/CUB domain